MSKLRPNLTYFAGLTPALLMLAIFFVAPGLWAIYTSLTNLALTGTDAANPRFIGLDNYERLLHNQDFLRIAWNSVVFVIGSAVMGQFLLGLCLALFFNHVLQRGYGLAKLAYGSVLVAWITPTLISGFLWVAMFDFYHGSLNTALSFVGVSPIDWLGKHPMASLVIVNTWRGSAFAMLVFLGAFKTIPTVIFEAARVDGANRWQQFRDHMVPNLRSVALLTLLSLTISAFGAVILIHTLTNGGPGIRTETLALYAFHTAFQSYQIGYGAAIAVVILVLNLLFGGVYLAWSKVKT